MYCAHVCKECGREKRFKTFGFNWIVTHGLGMNGGKVNSSGVRCDLDCCASELVYSQAVVITVMSLRLVLVVHFGQLSNLMLVLTFVFYIFIVVFFNDSLFLPT